MYLFGVKVAPLVTNLSQRPAKFVIHQRSMELVALIKLFRCQMVH